MGRAHLKGNELEGKARRKGAFEFSSSGKLCRVREIGADAGVVVLLSLPRRSRGAEGQEERIKMLERKRKAARTKLV